MKKNLFVMTLAAAVLLTQTVIPCPVFAQSTASTSDAMTLTNRISGEDRYQTAVAISQKGWQTAEYAVLARGDSFADALCAGPLALKYNGPILLTEPDSLNQNTLAELKRLNVKHLIIVGGTGAVSQNDENALNTDAYFGSIRTPIPEVSGQRNGNIRTP